MQPSRPLVQYSDPMPDQSLPWSSALVAVRVAYQRSQLQWISQFQLSRMRTVSLQTSFLHPPFQSNERKDIYVIHIIPRRVYRKVASFCQTHHSSDRNWATLP